ncbi:hypothetical protein, partial [Acinetobacter guillouiae]|uniref:hypothetical protein n=1 Tax=Acinetobacter guillouiae TaxID=106649 RepID=UPI001C068295
MDVAVGRGYRRYLSPMSKNKARLCLQRKVWQPLRKGRHRLICAELRVKVLENINKFVMMVWQILTSYCEYLPTTIIKSQS